MQIRIKGEGYETNIEELTEMKHNCSCLLNGGSHAWWRSRHRRLIPPYGGMMQAADGMLISWLAEIPVRMVSHVGHVGHGEVIW